MILNALSDYYERLLNSDDSSIPKFGFGTQKIHFSIVLTRKGELVKIVDIRSPEKKKMVPAYLTVPEAVKRTSGIASNFMWDNSSYVLGADSKGNPERALEAFDAFKKKHHELGDDIDDEGMAAVLSFIDSWKPEEAANLENWDEKADANFVFQLDDEFNYVHERPAIQNAWAEYFQKSGSDVTGNCLVTGREKPLARLHMLIKGVRGAQSSGAALVSFNNEAFCSYGKKQSFNAPVGEDAAFRYATALNYLLLPESRQKVQIGDSTTVFWTERESPVEDFLGNIWESGDDNGDNKIIRDFLEAVRDGKKMPGIDPDIKFFILGLSPNNARLSVRFWHVSTVGDILNKVGQHFKDLSIVKSYESDHEFPGMWELLIETAPLHKTENISPVLAGSIMRTILTGAPYPQSLLYAITTRVRADKKINYLRAAMIKACLSRRKRIYKQNIMEVGMALNPESKDIGYRIGRLFAVLEKVQIKAIPGINATIKDRYYGSASTTPRLVFPQLLGSVQNHIHKITLKEKAYGIYMDKLIEEIMCGIEQFPAHLKLEQQGLFALGYYHQRQALFTKSEEKKEK